MRIPLLRESQQTLTRSEQVMSQEVIEVQGTVQADGTLVLDRRLELPSGRVQIVVVPLPELPADDPFWQRMQAIWKGQKDRGHVPRSPGGGSGQAGHAG